MVIRFPGPRSTQEGSYAELEDRMLVLDFQAGHIEAFVEIHARYGALARHVCSRFLTNHQDVDEALQETWIRVFQGLHRFNGQYALQPWVSRIATNVSLDILRARARRPRVDDQPIEEHERQDIADGPEEEVEKLIQRDLVISVLAGLPDNHRRALVLRELEGRSHREIAAELDMTPAQAKALIHRAKGTFRREWLRAATERHGLAGILLIPFVWFSKLGGLARRVADRAGEAVHVGGTEVITQTAQAVSTPAVPMAASHVGEKIVAAGLTLLVAGGVTVGAATMTRDRGERAKEVVAAPAAPVVAPQEQEPAGQEQVVLADDAIEKGSKGDRAASVTQAGEEAATEDPVAVPTDTPTSEPTTPPSGEPTTDPSPPDEPSAPPVGPAPGWSFTFTSSNPSIEDCACDPTPQLVSSSLTGEPGADITFAQTVEGAVADAEGDPTWPFHLELSGSAGPSDGTLEAAFTLYSIAGQYLYDGTAVLAEAVEGEDGSVTYRFYGTYQLTGGADPVTGIPQRGFLTASLGVWPDGTIYLGSIALAEAA